MYVVRNVFTVSYNELRNFVTEYIKIKYKVSKFFFNT